MRTRIPRQITDYAAAIGVMTALLVSSLAVCAAPVVISAVIFHGS